MLFDKLVRFIKLFDVKIRNRSYRNDQSDTRKYSADDNIVEYNINTISITKLLVKDRL